ncbi:hypothetical protein [Bacillus sp. SA1-12]|uniref:hypothetical protein n=1 Tax=Bacillus sp. SA1-12 TaxID=1455638 RepID=UPI000695F023|nr:hypothetical protein [Bacillus sp. SA1-12]
MNTRKNEKVAKLVMEVAKFRSKVAKYLVSGTIFSFNLCRILRRKQRMKVGNPDWRDEMIIKKREIPLSVQKLKALLRRTPPNHSKYHIMKENLSKGSQAIKEKLILTIH